MKTVVKKKPTAKKKKTAVKKTAQKAAPISEDSLVEEVFQEEPEEITEQEEDLSNDMSEEEPQELRRYKFIATCNNLNISNVIFNNIKVIIYQINTTSFDIAFEEFKNTVLKMFNGDVPKYNLFMRSVFGDQITVESTPIEYVKEEIATLS